MKNSAKQRFIIAFWLLTSPPDLPEVNQWHLGHAGQPRRGANDA